MNQFAKNRRYVKKSAILVRSFYFIFAILWINLSYAQESSLYTEVIQPKKGDTITLAADYVYFSSIVIGDYEVEKDFEWYGSNRLIWRAPSPTEPLVIRYRKITLPITFENKNDSLIGRTFSMDPFRTGEAALLDRQDAGNLNTMGNISRGVGFGNAQDVVVNSNLNLNLSGTLPNGMEILAVISDENNPIQPEGNTQQLQDFDQVYIQLSKEKFKTTFGDFAMEQASHSYFMKYNKRSRGMQFENSWAVGKGILTTQGEVAISRGKFARNLIDGIEGNAGPYRLSGENGEQFLIIIAGTEVVYLDGRKLTRGEDHDYVVNYNTGEVTFTPRVLITKFSRIVVEFQYSDRNYARTVTQTGISYQKNKTTYYTHFFNEMDLKNQPFQQDTEGYDSLQSASVLELLSRAGDGQAFTSRVRKAENLDGNRPLYKKVNMGVQEFYEYTPPTDTIALFEVNFTNVGPGNGSYGIQQSGVNGRIFEYLGPLMGDYDPFEVLVSPERKNLWTFGFVNKQDQWSSGVEVALSGYDKNTFSNLDNEDNFGIGSKGFLSGEKKWRDTGYQLLTNVNFEMVSNHFSFIERYRDVEFDRIWNRLLVNSSALNIQAPALEFIGNAGLKLVKKGNFLEYQIATFQRGSVFEGYNHQIGGNFERKGYRFSAQTEFLNTTQQLNIGSQTNDFYKVHLGLQKNIKGLIAGVLYQNESSAFKENSSDSLMQNSFQFEQWSAFLQGNPEKRLNYELRMEQRIDQMPQEGSFMGSTLGRNINFGANYTSRNNHRFNSTIIYRTLELLDTTLAEDLMQQTLQSRQELDFTLLKGMIRSRTFLETGAGQEQRREFQYLQVQPGNGLYIWNDYNGDGIKTLDEFEIASVLDAARADHIKVFVPVAGFFTTITNKWSQTLEINPMKYFKRTNEAGKRALITRFYSITTMAMDKKVLPTKISEVLNPFFTENQEDTSLISQRQNFRSTLFFNRGNPAYTLDYTYLNNQSKLLLTNGFESRYVADHILKGRFNLSKLWIYSQKFSMGNRQFGNEFFTNRNFEYDFFEVEPEIALQIKNTYRFGLKGRYYDARNIEDLGGERAESLDVGLNVKYTKAEKGTADVSFSYVKVDFDGEINSNLAYDILRGLQNGNNYVWNVNYSQKLANSIQLVISYEGRTSDNSNVIHIGRLQARYLF